MSKEPTHRHGQVWEEQISQTTKAWEPPQHEKETAAAKKTIKKLKLFSWEQYTANVTDEKVKELAQWRGYSPECVQWMRREKLVGIYGASWAFPVSLNSATIGLHYRIENKDDGKAAWKYYPTGNGAQPFILGKFGLGNIAHCFESQWDMFTLVDQLRLYQEAGIAPGIALISTRSASNARLLDIPSSVETIYLWPQNDQAGSETWLAGALEALAGRSLRIVRTSANYKDLNDWVRDGDARKEDLDYAIENAEELEAPAKKLYFEALSPKQIMAYEAPPNLVLVGDHHIVRGDVFVIAGAPGVGKSRATLALAEAGATRYEWFGLTTHCNFKTLIIQNENGRYRLKRELEEINEPKLDNYLRICPPPPYGLCLREKDFCDQLQACVESWEPEVVIFDPWNALARDEKASDYLETFSIIREIFPQDDNGPAIGIACHTHKPKQGERANGRALLHLLSGSYVLGSVPRCVFVLQHASDDVNETRVVFTCCKNNDGELGNRSCWERQNGLFTAAHDFDWKAWEVGAGQDAVPMEIVAEILQQEAPKGLNWSNLAKAIEKEGVSRSTAYRRIKEAHDAGLIEYHQKTSTYTVVSKPSHETS
jgi:hypothetical protein